MNEIYEKPLTRIVILLCIIVSIIIFLMVDARFIAPRRFTVRHETLSSAKIPEQLDGMKILYFSDLEYGTFMDEKRCASLVETINSAAADVVVFGGDLFDYHAEITEEMGAQLQPLFASIEAPLGKFAVLGDNDHSSDEVLSLTRNILETAGFEILDNRSILLHNRGSQAITLVGLDNGLNGKQDIEQAYSTVSRTNYVITVCHTPDTFTVLPGDITDYFLAGHSHGGQTYYFFGAGYTPAMANEYIRGKHVINLGDFTMDITNGVGTNNIDVRFMCNAEVVVYTLRKNEVPVKPQEETAPPQENAEEQSEETPEEPAEGSDTGE